MTSTTDIEIARNIKEKLCYVAFSFDEETRIASASLKLIEKSYKLPNESIITFANERFKAPEAMFRPNLLGSSSPGFHEVLYNSIMKCDLI